MKTNHLKQNLSAKRAYQVFNRSYTQDDKDGKSTFLEDTLKDKRCLI